MDNEGLSYPQTFYVEEIYHVIGGSSFTCSFSYLNSIGVSSHCSLTELLF